MVLCKRPVPGRPANLDYSRARTCALAVVAGEGCLDIFLSSIICLLCPALSATTRYNWLVGCFGFNGALRQYFNQYFNLYRAVSQREGERGEKG